MELIWNQKGNELEKLTQAAIPLCSGVLAAVAYATTSIPLLESCFRHAKPVKMYARYDASGPVSDVVLNWFLAKASQSANYELGLVPDIFHPKVIWWRGVGAYIGSANLTLSAWVQNIEAGIYISEAELIDEGLTEQLDAFFEQVRLRSTRLTREIAEEMISMRDAAGRAEAPHEKHFEQVRLVPRLPSVVSVTRQKASVGRRDSFLHEWNQTLEILRNLGARLTQPQNRPSWLKKAVSPGVVADQFLHAFYYNRVKDGQFYPYREMYEANRQSPETAVVKAIRWWSETKHPPSWEDIHLFECERGVRVESSHFAF